MAATEWASAPTTPAGISEIPDTAGEYGAAGTEVPTFIVDAADTTRVSAAWERWSAVRPTAYVMRIGGTLTGREVEVDVLVNGDHVEQTSGSPTDADLSVDGLFEQIWAALSAGHRVEVGFDDALGYPNVVAIESVGGPPTLDLVSRNFAAIEQPASCRATPGAATDLAAEPLEWLSYADFIRWNDPVGCPIRVDVISDLMGPTHCGWESSEWITIGTPLGAPIRGAAGAQADAARTFIWDPDSVIAPHVSDRSVPVAELGPSVVDSGFRSGSTQLWLDALDPEHIYLIRNQRADEFVRVPDLALCA